MKPRTITNGYSDECVVFGAYGTDDDGEYLRIDEVTLPPGRDGPPVHRHLRGDERFEVLAGRLGLRLEDEEYILSPGEEMTVPRGAHHTWFNAGETTVVVRGELRNPGGFEELLTTIFSLINQGKVDAEGQPGLLQGSVVLAAYRGEYDAAWLPRPVKWLALNLLAPLGRAIGYRPVHEYVPPVSEVSTTGSSPERVPALR